MGDKGLLFTIFTMVTSLPEGDQALTENLQLWPSQTFIKHVLCTRHRAGRVSSVTFDGQPVVAQACSLGRESLGSKAWFCPRRRLDHVS